MRDSTLITLALGMVIGAVGVTMYKPAQNLVKKGTEMVKDETEEIIKKAKTTK